MLLWLHVVATNTEHIPGLVSIEPVTKERKIESWKTLISSPEPKAHW